MTKLTTIEGVGKTLERKFKKAGVGSVEALLREGSTTRGRKALAAATGVDSGRMLRFCNHADLMRIKGIGGEYSELLEASGVDTVVELSRRNPASLHATMRRVNEQKRLVRQMPSRSQVEDWVRQSRSLDRVMTY